MTPDNEIQKQKLAPQLVAAALLMIPVPWLGQWLFPHPYGAVFFWVALPMALMVTGVLILALTKAMNRQAKTELR